MIEIRLLLPPSINALYRNRSKDEMDRAQAAGKPVKGRAKTDRYRTWLTAAGWALKAARPKPIKGDYCLWLYCQRPDQRRRDLGNMEKAVSDLLVAHGVVTDDSRCVEIHAYWCGAGRECVVRVEANAMARAELPRAA